MKKTTTMKKDYITPISGYMDHQTAYRGSERPGFGEVSRGAASMHTNDSFFEEDTNEESWAQVGSLWED